MATTPGTGTATSQRTSLGIPVSPGIAKLLDDEQAVFGNSMSQLVRRIIWWHRGVGLPRHADAPAVEWAREPSDERILKTVMLDAEDMEYLEKLSLTMPCARANVMQALILLWFRLEAYPLTKPE